MLTNSLSRRGQPSEIWNQFARVQKQIHLKAPYTIDTAESRTVLAVQRRLLENPNPFKGNLAIQDQASKLRDLHVVLHSNEGLQKFFLETVFCVPVSALSVQMCPLPYCADKACPANAIGLANFRAELKEYRKTEVIGDTNTVNNCQ